jgi:hypothetical protein
VGVSFPLFGGYAVLQILHLLLDVDLIANLIFSLREIDDDRLENVVRSEESNSKESPTFISRRTLVFPVLFSGIGTFFSILYSIVVSG